MSDELNYWHQGESDEQKPIDAPKFGEEWEPKLWEPSPSDWNRKPIVFTNYALEPDLIKTSDGEYKLVGMSMVPKPPDPRVVPITVKGLFADPLSSVDVVRLQQRMAREVAKNLEAAILAGSPHISDEPLPPAPKRSMFMRFGLWLRSQIARLRELFARDDGEGWDY